MDSYLNSLVKKEGEVQEAVTEATEEIAEEVETAEEVVAPEGGQNSEPKAVEEAAEAEEPEIAQPEALEPEVAEEEPILGAPNIHKVGDTIAVSEIRVYNTPSTAQPGRVISGNVVYRGQVGGFNVIEYMRYGFGLAKGYTPDAL